MMGRVKRILFVIGLMGVAAVFAARAWLRERRNRSVYPASEAPLLLNPVRRIIQDPERTVRAFDLLPGGVVLELGPGPGYFTPAAVAAVGPAGRVVCLDLQVEMLTLLRDRMEQLGRRVDLVAGDATNLPFREGAFDRAYLVAVLGEVPDQPAALCELARILRAGGGVSFVETFTDPDYVRLPVMREMCGGVGLQLLDWRRQLLGYTARFQRPAAAGAS
jgi:ubiquinone/menaquinone biosynthesis C-methylase UbiE